MKTAKADLGAQLKRLREGMGWTQAQAAAQKGWAQPRISQAEAGQLSTDRLLELLELYQAEIKLVRRGQEPPTAG